MNKNSLLHDEVISYNETKIKVSIHFYKINLSTKNLKLEFRNSTSLIVHFNTSLQVRLLDAVLVF